MKQNTNKIIYVVMTSIIFISILLLTIKFYTNKLNKEQTKESMNMTMFSGFQQDSITGKWYKKITCKTNSADGDTFCSYGI
jgi:hypothetical protein